MPKIKPYNGLIFFAAIYIIGSSFAVYFDSYVSQQIDQVWFWMVSILFVLWVFDDKKQLKYHASFDYGAYVFFIWPIVVPVYLIQTRGKKSVFGVVAVLIMYLLPSIFWFIIDSYIWNE